MSAPNWLWLISYYPRYDSCVSPCIIRHWLEAPKNQPSLSDSSRLRAPVRRGRARTRTLRFVESACSPPFCCSLSGASTHAFIPTSQCISSVWWTFLHRRRGSRIQMEISAMSDGHAQTHTLSALWCPREACMCQECPCCALMEKIEEPTEKEICLDITGNSCPWQWVLKRNQRVTLSLWVYGEREDFQPTLKKRKLDLILTTRWIQSKAFKFLRSWLQNNPNWHHNIFECMGIYWTLRVLNDKFCSVNKCAQSSWFFISLRTFYSQQKRLRDPEWELRKGRCSSQENINTTCRFLRERKRRLADLFCVFLTLAPLLCFWQDAESPNEPVYEPDVSE